VQSFMTVVVGGVGNIWGTLVGAGMIGGLQKGIEWLNPSNTLAAQTYMILFIILFIQFRPRASSPSRAARRGIEGMGARTGIFRAQPLGPDLHRPCWRWWHFAVTFLSPRLWHGGGLDQLRQDLGKTLCLCLAALAMDLVWGYCGILSALAISPSSGWAAT
jgi:ABC-type branched-subunit amino acid transport system permease subunit